MDSLINFLDKNYKTFDKTGKFGCSNIIGLGCLGVCTLVICILLYNFISPLSSAITFLVILIFTILYIIFAKPVEHKYISMIKSFSGIDFSSKYRIWFIATLRGHLDIIVVFEKSDFEPIRERFDKMIENKDKYIDEYNTIGSSFEIYKNQYFYRNGIRYGFYKRFQSEGLGLNRSIDGKSWEHIELQVDYEDCTIRLLRYCN